MTAVGRSAPPPPKQPVSDPGRVSNCPRPCSESTRTQNGPSPTATQTPPPPGPRQVLPRYLVTLEVRDVAAALPGGEAVRRQQERAARQAELERMQQRAARWAASVSHRGALGALVWGVGDRHPKAHSGACRL